ncbi:Gfo/Idh/MocA family oxidoreductase [Actinomadura luteofluorescens]|uniref:Gfo/Idh/MocA family protein n=1 Tax=Actinomadura luteofluorescens TaxID=46163 RepID=UPI00362C69CD
MRRRRPRVLRETGRARPALDAGGPRPRRQDGGARARGLPAPLRRRIRGGAAGRARRTAGSAPPRPPGHRRPGAAAAEYVRSSGGIFRDCHIHDFDILRWVTGREVDSVTAVGANRGDAYFSAAGDVDTSAAVLALDDGTLATLQGSRYNGAGYDVRMELSGTAATWVVGLDERAPLRSAEPGVDWPPGGPWTDFQERFEPAYANEIGTFLEMARGRVDSPCTVDDALQALLVAEAATLSLREGRSVPLAEIR